MFKIHIPSMSVTLLLNSKDGDDLSKLVFVGDKIGQDMVRTRLSTTTGAFGHLFSIESTTPVDLFYAIESLFPNEEVKITKGAEMVENYSREIPKGACS